MKNFDWTCFTKKIAVKAPMSHIYDAWTKPAEIEKWFLKTARYKDKNGIEVSMNSNVTEGMNYEWSWFLYSEIEKGSIKIANGKDHFQFTFAGQCIVDVKLTEQYEHTVVELNQTNIPTDDVSKQEIRLGCSSGWSFYMVNLKSVFQGGLDLRSKDERLRPMVNN